MRCERNKGQIRAMARGEIIGSLKIREHVRKCLRCQAEMSRERRIQRQLQALRNDVPVPGGLVNRILNVVDTLDRRPAIARRRRSKFAGMCVVAIALLVGIGSRSGRRRAAQAS
jgi:hypothetical protein